MFHNWVIFHHMDDQVLRVLFQYTQTFPCSHACLSHLQRWARQGLCPLWAYSLLRRVCQNLISTNLDLRMGALHSEIILTSLSCFHLLSRCDSWGILDAKRTFKKFCDWGFVLGILFPRLFLTESHKISWFTIFIRVKRNSTEPSKQNSNYI